MIFIIINSCNINFGKNELKYLQNTLTIPLTCGAQIAVLIKKYTLYLNVTKNWGEKFIIPLSEIHVNNA